MKIMRRHCQRLKTDRVGAEAHFGPRADVGIRPYEIFFASFLG